MGVNIFRSSVLLLLRVRSDAEFVRELETLTVLVYVVAGLGIAFGFFWMTTSELSLEIEQVANVDPLTRIYNRRVFREWCEREMARSRRSGTPFSLLMIDLDHFKEINDRFGHQGGDELLCAVVERMQDSVRGIDVLGRWGGEEFVAVLPGASAEAAMLVAGRVRLNVEKIRLPPSSKGAGEVSEVMRMTVSLGVTTYRGMADDLGAMFRRADRALYRAKKAGRNRVVAAEMEALEGLPQVAAGGKEVELVGGGLGTA